MNTRFGDRLSLYSAVAMGLGASTGHPVGIVAAAGMPLACLTPGTRKAAFNSAFAYYVAGLWPMVPALNRYFGRSSTPLTPLTLWLLTAILLSVPWTIAWTSDRSLHCLWRAPLALLATIIPPLGIIGLVSPLTGAGYLFPRAGWAGLAAVALLPGILVSTQSLDLRQRCVVRGIAIGLCLGLAIAGRHFHKGDAEPPRGWIAINTHFGVSEPFRDFAAAQFVQEKAAKSSARVLVFPESVVPRWSEATEAFWRLSLDSCRRRGQILAIGAGLPAPTRIPIGESESLSNLRSYDFGAAIDALRRMDKALPPGINGGAPAQDRPKPRPEPIDNVLLVVGSESATFHQRVPVPVGMWRPLSGSSARLRLAAPGILALDHQRAAALICYEQMLTFPILASMLQHPTVIVGISNNFWVDGTPIPRYQANAVRGWAKLFGLPYLRAVNF